MYYVTEVDVHYHTNQLTVDKEVICFSLLHLLEGILLTHMCYTVYLVDRAVLLSLGNRRHYASVGGAPRHTVVVACVCVYVFHAHFSATAKN